MKKIKFKYLCVLISVAPLLACSGSGNSPDPAAQPAPVAMADIASSDNGAEVTIEVLANDVANGGVLSIDSVATPAHGQARVDGMRIAYRPEAGFLGVDRFWYQVRNARGQTATAEISVASVIALTLNGAILTSPGRDEAMQLVARVGAESALPAVTVGAGANFSVTVRSSDPEWPVYLEADGAPGSGLQLWQRYASLLPSMRVLKSVAQCVATQCTVSIEQEPRLLLGALPTAEYGLLRAYATHEQLLQTGKRRDLLGYLVGESLLRNAALIDRGAAGFVREELVLSVTNTLDLATAPDDLLKVYQPIGSVGSGGIANMFDLRNRERRMLEVAGWQDSAAGVSARLARAELTWLLPPTDHRLFSAWAWRDGRLLNQEDVSSQIGGLSNVPFERHLALATAVTVAAIDGGLEFQPTDAAAVLARLERCHHGPCTSQRVSKVRVQPLLHDYALVEAHGFLDDNSSETPLSQQMVTLVQSLPIMLPALPAHVFTTVGSAASDEHGFFFLSDDLELLAQGRFVISNSERVSGSILPSTLSGTASLIEQGHRLRLIDDTSHWRTDVQIVASGAGRSLTLIWQADASGRETVAVGGWLPLSALEFGGYPSAPFNCTPAIDGVAPLSPTPALHPAGLAYSMLSDGSARSTAPDLFAWRTVGIQLHLEYAVPLPPRLNFTPIALVGTGRLFHVAYEPMRASGTPVSASSLDQDLGSPLLLDCR